MDRALVIEEIRRLEELRCSSIVKGDLKRLLTLLPADLIHTHANGRVEGRDEYLENIRSRVQFLEIYRKDLVFVVKGGTVIVSGILEHKARLNDQEEVKHFLGKATQVWIKSGAEWRQYAFHATRLPQ